MPSPVNIPETSPKRRMASARHPSGRLLALFITAGACAPAPANTRGAVAVSEGHHVERRLGTNLRQDEKGGGSPSQRRSDFPQARPRSVNKSANPNKT